MKYFDNLTIHGKTAIMVVGAIIVMTLLSKWSVSGSRTYAPQTIRQCSHLVKQSLHYTRSASQESNLLYAYAHAIKASTTLRIAKSLATEEDLEKMTRMDITALQDRTEQQEESLLYEIFKLYPMLEQ